jgi:hypothetical protein
MLRPVLPRLGRLADIRDSVRVALMGKVRLRGDERLLYFDQLHWAQVAADADLVDYLRVHREAGRIAIAVSWFTLMETMKGAAPQRWRQLETMGLLGRGLFVRNFFDLVRLEHSRFARLEERDWLRSRIVTRNLGHAIGPGFLPSTVFGIIGTDRAVDTFESIVERMKLRDQLDTLLAGAARTFNERQTRITLDRKMVSEFVGVSVQALPGSREALASAFPSIAWMEGLVQRCVADGFEPNDLVDLSFLAAAVPYFDLVTCDRKMSRRVHALRATSPDLPCAQMVQGTGEGLRRAIDKLVAAR